MNDAWKPAWGASMTGILSRACGFNDVRGILTALTSLKCCVGCWEPKCVFKPEHLWFPPAGFLHLCGCLIHQDHSLLRKYMHKYLYANYLSDRRVLTGSLIVQPWSDYAGKRHWNAHDACITCFKYFPWTRVFLSWEKLRLICYKIPLKIPQTWSKWIDKVQALVQVIDFVQ